MKVILAWTARHALLFALLAIGIAAYQSGVAGLAYDWLRGAGMTTTAELSQRLDSEQAKAKGKFENSLTDFREASVAQRQAMLTSRKVRLKKVRRELAEAPGLLDRYHPEIVLERQVLVLEKSALESEIAVLETRLTAAALRSDLSQIRVPKTNAIKTAARRCDAANAAVREFNDQTIRWESEADELTTAAKTECGRARNLKRLRETGLQRAATLREKVSAAQTAISQLEKRGRENLVRARLDEAQISLGETLRLAGLALVGIILMPFAIRTIFFFVLAPIAERRAEIRVSVPDLGHESINSSTASKVSVSIKLEENEELLVRQGFIQTTSLVGRKSTRWLFDYRHMLSSFASGLRFLTRIRGEGETTTISAVHDPLAELAEIVIPERGACVLHPRSLVAVVQPLDRPIRIRSHWRLFSLNAWLTLQLRYLSFHGPGRLVLSGGRGIRVEAAENGRVFGQDQLIGFSADLAYSVARTETFAPYLFGKESLFKDRVKSGSGVLIIEEAPLAGKRGKGASGGLEGVFDAFLKVFGL